MRCSKGHDCSSCRFLEALFKVLPNFTMKNMELHSLQTHFIAIDFQKFGKFDMIPSLAKGRNGSRSHSQSARILRKSVFWEHPTSSRCITGSQGLMLIAEANIAEHPSSCWPRNRYFTPALHRRTNSKMDWLSLSWNFFENSFRKSLGDWGTSKQIRSLQRRWRVCIDRRCNWICSSMLRNPWYCFALWFVRLEQIDARASS